MTREDVKDKLQVIEGWLLVALVCVAISSAVLERVKRRKEGA